MLSLRYWCNNCQFVICVCDNTFNAITKIWNLLNFNKDFCTSINLLFAIQCCLQVFTVCFMTWYYTTRLYDLFSAVFFSTLRTEPHSISVRTKPDFSLKDGTGTLFFSVTRAREHGWGRCCHLRFPLTLSDMT